MDSVGPVDFGDGGALPDFSRNEQGKGALDSPPGAVKERISPLSPACRNVGTHVHTCAARKPFAVTESPPELVRIALPWFMPVIVHKPRAALS